MAAPTGHMACAVCLAPSVSVRRSTVVSLVLACHCSFAGAYAASRALVLATSNAARASLRHAGLAWLLLHRRESTRGA